MVFKNLYLLILFILLGCSSSPESVVSSLPVIDIDKARDYPVKRIEIREVADVEYIPLETTKKLRLMLFKDTTYLINILFYSKMEEISCFLIVPASIFGL